MLKTSSVSRLYGIGGNTYENIRFSSDITEIPEVVWTNQSLMDKLRLSQLLTVELSYLKYLAVHNSVSSADDLEAAISELESLHSTTFSEFLSEYSSHLPIQSNIF